MWKVECFGVVLLCLIVCSYSICNKTAHEIWTNQRYQGNLASDPTFWRYQKNNYFVLTNGLATDISMTKCSLGFSNLFTFLAGRNGPVSIFNSYRVMCSDYCLESDSLHEEAMAASGCTCRELSLEEDDFCKQNSARILCDVAGYCGLWECRIDDFMCPRYEWNKKRIFMKGYGHCIRRQGLQGAIDAGVRGSAPSGFSKFRSCDNSMKVLFSIFIAFSVLSVQSWS